MGPDDPDYCLFWNPEGFVRTPDQYDRHRKSFLKLFPDQKEWRFHDLRHSFAYNFLKNGGEMYQLKAILGHKSIKMTVDYYGSFKAVDVENVSPY